MTYAEFVFRLTTVDVFTSTILAGNPVAVVHDAEALDDERLAEFARWTNLSETTYLLPPTVTEADYRLRIFTPGGELPFAGHPTIGSARAWLGAGGSPRASGVLVQECGVGLVRLRLDHDRIGFAAPPLVRSGPADPATRKHAARALRVDVDSLLAAEWVDNGPGWLGVMLDSAETVLALEPDFGRMQSFGIGVIAPLVSDGEATFETRAFIPSMGIAEDPVTGSLAAGFARAWAGTLLPRHYVVRQGSRLQRRGLIHVDADADDLWISGEAVVGVSGWARLSRA